MTGFEPATTRPPAVYANRTAPHPELFFLKFKENTFYVIFKIQKAKTISFDFYVV